MLQQQGYHPRGQPSNLNRLQVRVQAPTEGQRTHSTIVYILVTFVNKVFTIPAPLPLPGKHGRQTVNATLTTVNTALNDLAPEANYPLEPERIRLLMAQILVVDDEATLLATLRFNLEREGFEVITSSDGGDALKLVDSEHPDLILLDLMLPGMHGFEVCRTLRKRTSVPIVILTARTEEVDRVVGLELGADDYITKPFSMVELLAPVRACLRRAGEFRAADEPQVISSGSLAVDLSKREAAVDGTPIELKPKEFDLLVALMQNRGQTLTREQLLLRVWKYESLGSSRTVDVHIARLRQKIEDDPDRPIRIVTIRGTGYRFDR